MNALRSLLLSTMPTSRSTKALPPNTASPATRPSWCVTPILSFLDRQIDTKLCPYQFFPKALDGTEDKFPRPCNAARTEEGLIEYLNSNCGTYRTPGGTLSSLAGRLPALDALASKWLGAGEGSPERTAILEQARHWRETMLKASNVSSAPDKDVAAQYYLRVMDKVAESKDYLEKETARITGILRKNVEGTSQLAGKKVDEIGRAHV